MPRPKLFQAVFRDVEITGGSDPQGSVVLAWRLDILSEVSGNGTAR